MGSRVEKVSRLVVLEIRDVTLESSQAEVPPRQAVGGPGVLRGAGPSPGQVIVASWSEKQAPRMSHASCCSRRNGTDSALGTVQITRTLSTFVAQVAGSWRRSSLVCA